MNAPRQVDRLFDRMLGMGASDLHLHQGQPAKVRVHGTMRVLPEFPVMDESSISTMMRELCGSRWNEFDEGHDLDFACDFGDKARFRANFKKHYHGYGAVFRVIPSHILTLEELNAPPVLKEFAEYRSGLCLVTGPTGSGKSTTLAAVIDHINSTRRSTILTIEEPIEFVHKSRESMIIQREVGVDVTTFGEGLRGALRQDVEVVLVGEMRDLETIRLAVTAAETGLLVFGTLHTNNAIKTIDRIIDVFPSDEQSAVRESLATALRAVCAQQLLPKADGNGRIAVHEILIQNRAVSNLIREAKTNQITQAMMSGKAQGMQLLDDVLENLVKQRAITPQSAWMKATDKDRFQALLA
jgi:twitching motility protein PilT